MITANELRIGNWLQSNLNPIKINVIVYSLPLGTSHSEWQIDTNIGTYDFKDLDPIPLTPGILESVGFEKKEIYSRLKDNSYFVFENFPLTLNTSFGVNDWLQGWFVYKQILETDIRYVHQLQNLYFALTGEELEVLQPTH